MQLVEVTVTRSYDKLTSLVAQFTAEVVDPGVERYLKSRYLEI